MHKPVGLVLLSAMLALAGTLAVEAQRAATPGVHPISGRRYAGVMSWEGAPWLERSERVQEEEPDIAIKALNLTPGAIVADVGAGSGYMSEKLAAAVGPTGKVYANDIQPQMIQFIRQRIAERKLTNIEPVLGAVNDPKLPEGAIDLILMVDVYHELQEPQVMLAALHRALKPQGRLVLLEYRKEDPNIPIRPEHKMSVAEAKLELEAEGFALTKVDETLPRQHILIFTRR